MKRSLALCAAVFAVCGFWAPRQVVAQALIAPTALTLSDGMPTGTLLVVNQSGDFQEVTIEFRFGYPVTDAEGKVTMAYGEDLPAVDWSAARWVQAFPKRFLLPPEARQVVRVLARPPSELPDGTYWTRVVTATASQARSPFRSTSKGGATIDLRVEQITTLLYRQGDARTAVEPGEATVAADTETLRLQLPMQRSGNSPFLGTVKMSLYDDRGRRVGEVVRGVAVYTALTAVLVLDRRDLPSGSYHAELSITSERNDIPAADLLRISPVHLRYPIELP